METLKENEIVLYQPNETIKLEVRVENDSVWLNQAQMSVLFGTGRQAITKHIKNIYACGELLKEATCSILELVRLEGSRNVTRRVEFYNLDVIISVGYRVNTISGIHFRQWATTVLKEHLLKGFSFNARLAQMEDRIDRRLSAHDHLLQLHEEKIDFFIRTSLPPIEGVLFEGQVFDARLFAENLIKPRKRRSSSSTITLMLRTSTSLNVEALAWRQPSSWNESPLPYWYCRLIALCRPVVRPSCELHAHETRPLPYHRQPSLSSGCIAQGLGQETFCLQQDGVGQGIATGTSNLR